MDPFGSRTIGVITKLDLVSPSKGRSMLENGDYPLPLGYIGVVCPPDAGKARPLVEKSFFAGNETYFGNPEAVGVDSLKQKLVSCLSGSMASSLDKVQDALESELEEARYQFKVLYNDRPISAEAYVTNIFMQFKSELGSLASQFGRGYVRSLVRQRLEGRFVDICDKTYWFQPETRQLDARKSQAIEWIQKMYASASSLTKSGIGRTCTHGLYESVDAKIEEILERMPFHYHRDALSRFTLTILHRLKTKLSSAIDQVENGIKPLKYQVEFTRSEWENARHRVLKLMDIEISKSSDILDGLYQRFGQRRIYDSLVKIDLRDANLVDAEVGLAAEEAAKHHFRIKMLKERKQRLSDGVCQLPYSLRPKRRSGFFGFGTGTSEAEAAFGQLDPDSPLAPRYEVDEYPDATSNVVILRDPCQSYCPELYLYIILEKALSITSLFVYSELVQDFLETLTLTDDLNLYHQDPRWIRDVARNNPTISEQLKLQDRKDTLERAREKLHEILRNRSTVPPAP